MLPRRLVSLSTTTRASCIRRRRRFTALPREPCHHRRLQRQQLSRRLPRRFSPHCLPHPPVSLSRRRQPPPRRPARRRRRRHPPRHLRLLSLPRRRSRWRPRRRAPPSCARPSLLRGGAGRFPPTAYRHLPTRPCLARGRRRNPMIRWQPPPLSRRRRLPRSGSPSSFHLCLPLPQAQRSPCRLHPRLRGRPRRTFRSPRRRMRQQPPRRTPHHRRRRHRRHGRACQCPRCSATRSWTQRWSAC